MVFADKKMYLQPFSIIFKYVYERTFAYKIIIGNRLQARKRFRTALKLTQASSVKTCQRPGICRRKSYWIKKAILPGNYAQSAYKWRLACETARPAGFGRDKLLAMYII